MLNVLWEIIIPILLASMVGLFIGWLLWRWRRARVTKVEWHQVQQRTADAERNATELASTNNELDARASTLDVELESVRRHLDRVRSEHGDLTVQLGSTQSSLSASVARVEELDDALSRARSQLKGFASMPSMLTAAQARIGELEAELEAAKARIADFESELDAANDQILVDELGGELPGGDGALRDFDSMPADLETARGRAVQLEADLAAVNRRVVQMGADLARANGRAGDVDGDVAQAQAELQTFAPMPDRLEGEHSARHELDVELDLELTDALTRLVQVQDELADGGSTAPSLDEIDRLEWEAVKKRPTSHGDWRHGVTKLGTPGARHTDDLKVISGIGSKTEIALSRFGIQTWEQISALEASDIELVTEAIDAFPGRVERDAWVEQAKELIEQFPQRDERPTKDTFLNRSDA